MKQPISVTILGERYTIQAAEGAEYVQRVATVFRDTGGDLKETVRSPISR